MDHYQGIIMHHYQGKNNSLPEESSVSLPVEREHITVRKQRDDNYQWKWEHITVKGKRTYHGHGKEKYRRCHENITVRVSERRGLIVSK